MLTLSKINEKLSAGGARGFEFEVGNVGTTANVGPLKKAGARGKHGRVAEPPPIVEEERDEEWGYFLEELSASRDQVQHFLLTEFQNKSKETGNKCVDYLKKLLVKTYTLAKSKRAEADKSALAIFRALFDLAQGNWSLPSQVMDDMVGIGNNAVRDFSSDVLVKYLTEHGFKEMEEVQTSLTSRWIEMFVKFVSVLSERGDIPFENDLIKGKAFREYVVNQICRMDWTKPVVRSFLTLLEEIHGLEGSEMSIILQKFGTALKTMQPSIIHSCVNQIVSITGKLRPGQVLEIFDKYFLHVQKDKDKNPQAKANTSKGRGGKRVNQPEKEVSLGIVACNFVDACRHCEPLVREVLKRVKASLFDHTLVTSPFMLTVILSMTSLDYLRAQLIDPLRTTIIKSFYEINLCNSSYWYKETIGTVQDDIFECFKNVMKEGSNAMEYMTEGLKELGVSLLNSGTLQWKYPMTFNRCRELGSFLLTTVVTNNKDQLAFILKELLKPDSSAHIDCLAQCLGQCSRTLGHRDFYGRMSELLHHLPIMSVESASPIVKSLLPSLYMSSGLMDELMIVLRKTFWKSLDAGRICVEVMCVILSNTYVMGNTQIFEALGGCADDDLIFSQCTQGVARSETDRTPICSEILNLAKRFFRLECKVREQLYLGLHRVARRNPKLNDIISGLLHGHVSLYLHDPSEGYDCPVKFELLFEFFPRGDRKVVVQDELGFLVQCVGFVYSKTNIVINQVTDATSVTNCKHLLDQLIKFGTSVDINHLEIVASDIIGNSGLASDDGSMMDVIRFVKDTICIQTMQIIEALIELLSISPENWPQGKKNVSRLFKKHQEVDKYMKEYATAKKTKEKGKGGKKTAASKKKDANNTTKGTQADTDTASVVSGSSVATASKSKRGEHSLKPPQNFHLMNLDSVCQMLRSLYGPEKDLKPQLKGVQGVDDFEMILLDTIIQKVSRIKNKESIRERQRAPVDTLNSLSCLIETIWERMNLMVSIWKAKEPNTSETLLSENTDVVEARLKVITFVLDLFSIEGHHKRILCFRKYQAEIIENETEFCTLFFKQWKRICSMVTQVFNGTTGLGCALLFRVLNSVCKTVSSREILSKIQEWCWSYLIEGNEESEGTNGLLEDVANLFITCSQKCVKYSTEAKMDCLRLSKEVRSVIGNSDHKRPTQQRGPLSWLITIENVPELIICLVNYIDCQLGMINTVFGRLKAHRAYLGNDQSQVMRESCFAMITALRKIAGELVRSNFPTNSCGSQMLKLVTKFYSVLSGISEHYIELYKVLTPDEISTRSFKSIVSEFGLKFKPEIEEMIQHVDHDQRRRMMMPTAARGSKPPKVSTAAVNKFSKDAKLIPDMIYHIEKFDQLVIALSKKAKVDMLVGVKLSTGRSYRLGNERIKQLGEDNNASVRPDTADTSTTTRTGTSTAVSGRAGTSLRRKK